MKIQLHKQEELQSLDKNISGVYGLFYHGDLIYVGQSQNVRNRLKHHYSKTAITTLEKTMMKEDEKYHEGRRKQLEMYYFIQDNIEFIYWMIIVECEVKDLNQWEQKIIETLQPRYNQSGVTKPYVPVDRSKRIVAKLDKAITESVIY